KKKPADYRPRTSGNVFWREDRGFPRFFDSGKLSICALISREICRDLQLFPEMKKAASPAAYLSLFKVGGDPVLVGDHFRRMRESLRRRPVDGNPSVAFVQVDFVMWCLVVVARHVKRSVAAQYGVNFVINHRCTGERIAVRVLEFESEFPAVVLERLDREVVDRSGAFLTFPAGQSVGDGLAGF